MGGFIELVTLKVGGRVAFKKYVMPVKCLVRMNQNILFMVEILCLNLMPFRVPRCQNPLRNYHERYFNSPQTLQICK